MHRERALGMARVLLDEYADGAFEVTKTPLGNAKNLVWAFTALGHKVQTGTAKNAFLVVKAN